MAKEAKTTKTEKAPAKAVKKAEAVNSWANLSLKELKAELEKLTLDVKTGKEQNTSLVKKLKRLIAQEMTKLNLNKSVK